MLRCLLVAGVGLVAACGGAGEGFVGSSTSTTAPAAVLEDVAGIAFGPYDQAARASGHFLMAPDAGELALPGVGMAVVPFGEEVCVGGACRTTTGLELHGLRAGTEVLAAGPGTVEAVDGDAVLVRAAADPEAIVRYDHVADPTVAPGVTVTTGQTLGRAAVYAEGRFAKFTLSVFRGGTPVCPIEVLPPDTQPRVTGDLLQYFIEWNALVGREVHDRRKMSPIGCVP